MGPIDGFFPVPGIEILEGQEFAKPQLWIPEGFQTYEARCLALKVAQSPDVPSKIDRIYNIVRGGSIITSTLMYSNELKWTESYQTTNYDKQNNRSL